MLSGVKMDPGLAALDESEFEDTFFSPEPQERIVIVKAASKMRAEKRISIFGIFRIQIYNRKAVLIG